MTAIQFFSKLMIAGAAASTAFSIPTMAQAQAEELVLEEVVVTAQRREQLQQDVPLSIEAFSGAEIARQNFRDPGQLANFSPTLFIDDDESKLQTVLIRGIGTTGNSLHLEQAVPIFNDGIHLGRQSMSKLAFLDVERIEVLKGPQPVYFGMNAVAGAIGIISRKPTATWEGQASARAASFDTVDLSFGVGGPLTDTLGIRVAGKFEQSDGFMRDVVRGGMGPHYENAMGRVIAQWAPRANLEVMGKLEYGNTDRGGDVAHLCLIPGSLIHGRGGQSDPGEPDEDAIWADPPKGMGWDGIQTPLDFDCYGSNKGIVMGGPYFQPPIWVRQQHSNLGMLDVRDVAAEIIPSGNLNSFEQHEIASAHFNVLYQFDNGVELSWDIAGTDYLHNYTEDNTASPFMSNVSTREEDFQQLSTELRISSPIGERFEWMAGLHAQQTDNDNFSSALRPNVRRGQRFNVMEHDAEWLSAFGSVTFNFMDDKASIDIGGRYSRVTKDVLVQGVGRTWVYDVTPCHPEEPLPADPDNCTLGLHPDAIQISEADTALLLEGADTSNLWTIPWRDSRSTPATWRGAVAAAVGVTEFADVRRESGHDLERDEGSFDPQIVLRYRPTETMSAFFRWATAFKAGGFDTGKTSIPSLEEFAFSEENGETFELGLKGSFWDRRGRYDITAFTFSVEDLQLSTASVDPDQDSASTNAGEQRVRGVEGSVTARVTEGLTLNLAGALLDGEMTDFPGAGCTDDELEQAPESGCDPETRRIDRTGQEAENTPGYKFVLTADYWRPVFNDYQINLNIKGYVSDSYVTSLSSQNEFPAHEDLNVSVGFGNARETWMLSVFANNLLEVRDRYDPALDDVPNGFLSTFMSQDQFTSYGAKFEYFFAGE